MKNKLNIQIKNLKEYSLQSKLHLDAVTHKFRTASGITLVALVVTIIVLLILAGVSLNLVAGSNGILSRANNAVNSMNLAKIKEELELKIAELQLDYYSESSLQSTYTSANEYVKAELKKGVEVSNGIEISCDDDGKLTYGELEIGTLNPDGTVSIDGEINGGQVVAKYKVTYNANGGTGSVPTDSTKYENGDTVTVDFSIKPTKKGSNFLGWATSSSATTPEYTGSGSFTIKGNTTLYAVWEKLLGTAAIQPEFYGDTVKYSANSVNDWKVFLNDGSNVYLISSDYVPSSGMTITSDVTKVTGSDYKITGNSRDGLVTWLITESNWNNYATGFSGATATGGPTKAQFCASYNAKYGTDHPNGLGSSDYFTVTNKVVPYIISSTTSAIAYWLASAYSASDGGVWYAYSNGAVNVDNYAYTTYGVRPLVKLPVSAKMSWNGSSWDLSN